MIKFDQDPFNARTNRTTVTKYGPVLKFYQEVSTVALNNI